MSQRFRFVWTTFAVCGFVWLASTAAGQATAKKAGTAKAGSAGKSTAGKAGGTSAGKITTKSKPAQNATADEAGDAPRAERRERPRIPSEEEDTDASVRPVAGEDTDAEEGTAETTLQISAELEAILKKWEAASAKVKYLEGTFSRHSYDLVMGVDKQNTGAFYFKSPDRGRMDFEPVELNGKEKSGRTHSRTKKPFRVISGPEETWLCTGTENYQFRTDIDGAKTYFSEPIPPQHQGDKIKDSPLPFLFGMKAAEAKRRYHLAFGTKNDLKNGKLHLVVGPKLPMDQRYWVRAELIVDSELFLPEAVRLIHNEGLQESVYVFDSDSFEVNKPKFKWWKLGDQDPFKPRISGYKKAEPKVAEESSSPEDTDRTPQSKQKSAPRQKAAQEAPPPRRAASKKTEPR